MPLAMPLMIGPGPIATVLGMMATIEHSSHEALAFGAILAAIFLAVAATYACLAFATPLTKFMGPLGIDAATRIVGFFVSAMGVSLVFGGVVDALQSHGMERSALAGKTAGLMGYRLRKVSPSRE